MNLLQEQEWKAPRRWCNQDEIIDWLELDFGRWTAFGVTLEGRLRHGMLSFCLNHGISFAETVEALTAIQKKRSSVYLENCVRKLGNDLLLRCVITGCLAAR